MPWHRRSLTPACLTLTLAVTLILSCASGVRALDGGDRDSAWDVDADHYRTLGLRRNAHASEVKRAFRRLSLLYHPDKTRGRTRGDAAEAQKRFERVLQAHDVLVDEGKRRAYDAKQASRGLGLRSQKTRGERRWSSSSPLVTLHPATMEKDMAKSDELLWLVLFRGGGAARTGDPLLLNLSATFTPVLINVHKIESVIIVDLSHTLS